MGYRTEKITLHGNTIVYDRQYSIDLGYTILYRGAAGEPYSTYSCRQRADRSHPHRESTTYHLTPVAKYERSHLLTLKI